MARDGVVPIRLEDQRLGRTSVRPEGDIAVYAYKLATRPQSEPTCWTIEYPVGAAPLKWDQGLAEQDFELAAPSLPARVSIE